MDQTSKPEETSRRHASRVVQIVMGVVVAIGVITTSVFYWLAPVPTVHGAQGDAGETIEIHKNDALTFVFDQSMHHSSVEEAFVVAPHIAGQFAWEGNTLTFDPAYALEKGTTYVVTIRAQARAWYGKGLAQDYTQSYFVRNDPEVSVVAPVNGVTIRPAQILTVLFDRPMRTLTGLLDVPEYLEIVPPIAGEYNWLGTSGFEFVPADGWAPATSYAVTLPNTIVLADGSSLAEDYSWTFATPNLKVSIPRYADDRQGTDEPVKLSFNYAVDPAIVAGAMTVYEKSVPGEGQPGEATEFAQVPTSAFQFARSERDDRIIEVIRTGGWELGKQYQFVLPQGFTGGLGPNGLEEVFSQIVTTDEVGFRILRACPESGQTKPVSGSMMFVVSNPADQETFEQAITISPPLENMEISRYGYVSGCRSTRYEVGVYGSWKPSTEYTITVSNALVDVYGQRLENPMTYTVTTLPYPSSLSLQSYQSIGVLASHMPRVYQARAMNLTKPITATVCSLTFDEYWSQAATACGEQFQKIYDPTHDLNAYKVLNFDLDDIAGGELPEGFYRLIIETPELDRYSQKQGRFLIVTDTALTMKRDNADRLLVWATDMQTGDVVAGVDVDVYARNLDDRGYAAIATAQTDAQGIASFALDENAMSRLVGVRMQQGERNGLVMSDWGDGISPWNFGLDTNYGTPFEHHIGYLYTDRRIYRPDQAVYFKGVIREDRDAALSIPDLSEVEVVLEDPNGVGVEKQTLTLSEYGTFNGTFQLVPTMALGNYTFSVSIDGQRVTGSFSVLEYRRPDFRVTVGVPGDDARAGDTLRIPMSADYYYGLPLADATVEYVVRRRALYYQPLDRKEWYSFSEREDSYCWWFCGSQGNLEEVASGTATLDANGQFTLELPAVLTDYASSATYFVTATVTDINERQVSANEQFNVHKGDFYVGIRPNYDDGWSSPTAVFDLLTLMPDGTELPGVSGSVSLYKRTWSNVQKEGTNGDAYWNWVSTDTLVSTLPFTTQGDAKTSVRFAPEDDGEYVAVATARDGAGRTIRASASRWVYRGGYASTRVSDDHTMKIVQNRADYDVGDVASLMVETPYEQTKALVTIERDTVRTSYVVDLGTASRTIDIPITQDMIPNVYVSVLAMQGGGETYPEFRLGYANLQVNTTEKVLGMTVETDRAVYKPGDAAKITVQSTHHDGSPAQAEVSIAVVDERVVALLGSIDKNILGRFWFLRNIGVFTSQTLTQLVRKIFVETEGGSGKGGGEGESVAVRGNFKDTAFWRADVVTGPDGRGTVAFDLPDNLTTWQVLAIGATKDTVVGSAETSIVTRLDLMVEPVLPRIVRYGDTMAFGATVSNLTDQSIVADVELSAEGVELTSPAVQTVAIGPNARTAVSWNVSVPMQSSGVKVTVTAQGGGLSDGFAYALPALPYSVPEIVSASNAFGRTATESVEIPEGILEHVGDVTTSVTTNVGTGLSGGFEYLTDFYYGCAEQTASALIAGVLYETLASSKLISGDDELAAKAKEKIEASIKQLVSEQRPSGAWGYWPDSFREYPHLTAYVFRALTMAEQAGYEVDIQSLDRADQYLRNHLASPIDSTQFGLSVTERVQVLFMLAERNPSNLSGYAATLYEHRASLSLFGKSFLAMALHAIDANDTRADDLLDEVKSGVVYLSPSEAYITEDTGYNDYFMNSNIRSTSLYLQALLRIDPKNEEVDRLVRYLMTQRQDGYWYSTQNTAMVLQGLTDFVKRHPIDTEPLDVSVYLDDRFSTELAFESGDLSGERSVSYPISDLLADGRTHTFGLQKDSEKRYFYDISMTVFREIENIEPFENGFTLLADVYALDDTTYAQPLTEIPHGDTVRVHMKLLVPKEHRNVALEYHLPAGLEALDFKLNTSPQSIAGEAQQCVPDWSGETYCLSDWELSWWWENVWEHIEYRDDRVFLFADRLAPGIYEYDFLASAVTAGTFRVPPARIYEFYNPLANAHNEGKIIDVVAE